MPSFIKNYNSFEYRAYNKRIYDGVVLIELGGYYGTGALLYDGRAILTAAHLIEEFEGDWIKIDFEYNGKKARYLTKEFTIHPEYDSENINNDLAIVWLQKPAPVEATRYQINRDDNELFKTGFFIGYGLPANGWEGYLNSFPDRKRRVGENKIEAFVEDLDREADLSWTPLKKSQILADFDSLNPQNDAFGMLLGIKDLGIRDKEAILTPGDSGGPFFIEEKIAGVASYSLTINSTDYHPDIDDETDGTFGEISSWQRVSFYKEWIDKNIRANYENAPKSPKEVEKEVSEDRGYVYFLVEFFGEREKKEYLSVKYATRDGSAKAYEDYIPVEGELILYPDETKAVIMVEIIDDFKKEDTENFYLDIFDPVGGSFPQDAEILSAERIIIDDDLV